METKTKKSAPFSGTDFIIIARFDYAISFALLYLLEV